MFRKILSAVFALFMFVPFAHSAEMVNVEYVHKVLLNRWGIDLPYNPALKNPQVAANMKYLLTVVDIANAYLNGKKTTDYGNGEYATLAAADTIATNTAMDTLVNMPTFTITTTPDTTSFMLMIGASGNFVIDWGDGNTEKILNKTIGMGVYEHTYATAGTYEIKLSGRATGYPTLNMETGDGIVFSVMNSGPNVAKISGKLGQIFSTLPDGTNPNFAAAFGNTTNLTEIPADLFDGVSGAPVLGMFASTFSGSGITSIPDGLFDGIVGAPAEYMFNSTFSNTQITSVPTNVFGNLTGDGAPNMFDDAFRACSDLTTIEGPLFAGTLTPVEGMFSGTFSDSGITSVPTNVFGNLTGDGAPYMFMDAFYGCDNLTTIEGPLYSGTLTPAENMFADTFFNTQITSVPANVFGNLKGDGAPNMFTRAFSNCKKLTTIEGPLYSGTLTTAEEMFAWTFPYSGITSVPTNVFGNLTGDGAPYMFRNTFDGCDNLTTIEGPLYSGTLTPAEGMFSRTFYDSGITSVPTNVFGNLTGDGAPNMFADAFRDCSDLTTIEGPLYSGTLTPAESMFTATFSNTQITSIPDGLFAGISGAPAEEMFDSTFSNTPITSIPDGLFAGISGAPAGGMFTATFYNTQITSIPDGLFDGIVGAPASRMFYRTFYNTQITSIPDGLFAGISGAPAEYMFYRTFYNTQITSIPDGLFDGIVGAPAVSMFDSTFYNTQITSIPDGLFAGISGAPRRNMFASTFESTPITSIPENLFGDISGAEEYGMFGRTFAFCTSLTGPSARIGGKYLYEIWPDYIGGTYVESTGLSDYDQIPSGWK